MKRRSIGLMVLWTVITLGIYQLFWLYDTKEDMNRLGNTVLPIKILLAPLLAFIGVALLQFVFHFVLTSAGLMPGSSPRVAVNVISVMVGIIAVLAIFPLSIYYLYKYSLAVDKVTHGQLSFPTCLILYVALSVFGLNIVWAFVVQSYFNKVGDGTLPGQPQPFPPAPVS